VVVPVVEILVEFPVVVVGILVVVVEILVGAAVGILVVAVVEILVVVGILAVVEILAVAENFVAEVFVQSSVAVEELVVAAASVADWQRSPGSGHL